MVIAITLQESLGIYSSHFALTYSLQMDALGWVCVCVCVRVRVRARTCVWLDTICIFARRQFWL